MQLPVGHAFAFVAAALLSALHFIAALAGGIHPSSVVRWTVVATAVLGTALLQQSGRALPWATRWGGLLLLWIPVALERGAILSSPGGLSVLVLLGAATVLELSTIRPLQRGSPA